MTIATERQAIPQPFELQRLTGEQHAANLRRAARWAGWGLASSRQQRELRAAAEWIEEHAAKASPSGSPMEETNQQRGT